MTTTERLGFEDTSRDEGRIPFRRKFIKSRMGPIYTFSVFKMLQCSRRAQFLSYIKKKKKKHRQMYVAKQTWDEEGFEMV